MFQITWNNIRLFKVNQGDICTFQTDKVYTYYQQPTKKWEWIRHHTV